MMMPPPLLLRISDFPSHWDSEAYLRPKNLRNDYDKINNEVRAARELIKTKRVSHCIIFDEAVFIT